MTTLSDFRTHVHGDMPILRRTDEHIMANNTPTVHTSGDVWQLPKMQNYKLNTTPDDDPHWGNTSMDTYVRPAKIGYINTEALPPEMIRILSEMGYTLQQEKT